MRFISGLVTIVAFILGAVLVMPIAILASGYTVCHAWNSLAVPILSLSPITTIQGFGLSLVFIALKGYPCSSIIKKEYTYNQWWMPFAIGIMWFVFTNIMIYVCTWFI